jgi:TRAP-type C4-dicarboxylate transport system permease small subunit
MAHDPNPEARSASPEDGDRLLHLERLVAALAMAGICAISFANVLVRYISNYSFAFTEEYSTFLMVLLTFVGASIGIARRSHMRVAFFAEYGRNWRRFCRAVARLASLVMFGLIAWYGGWLAWDEYRFEELSAGLGIPSWRYTVWMPLLSVHIMGRILFAWWQEERGAR